MEKEPVRKKLVSGLGRQGFVFEVNEVSMEQRRGSLSTSKATAPAPCVGSPGEPKP